MFYESNAEDLHRRHAFTHTRSPTDSQDAGPSSDTALDVVALDCEMIYTTGGMRVARVSVIDSAGKEIFDEYVQMDEGVEVMCVPPPSLTIRAACVLTPARTASDLNTRFSGITDETLASALMPLATIRRSMDAFINAHTIIIGHALENDLKTLRMIHHRCVDTAVLFPHPAGPPYRRALRAL